MKLADLKKKFKDKWVLARVIREDKNGESLEVEPIKVSQNRDEVYRAIREVKDGEKVETFYTGPIPAKGTVFAF